MIVKVTGTKNPGVISPCGALESQKAVTVRGDEGSVCSPTSGPNGLPEAKKKGGGAPGDPKEELLGTGTGVGSLLGVEILKKEHRGQYDLCC